MTYRALNLQATGTVPPPTAQRPLPTRPALSTFTTRWKVRIRQRSVTYALSFICTHMVDRAGPLRGCPASGKCRLAAAWETTLAACGIRRLHRSMSGTSRGLKPAWTYHTRELVGRTGKTIECTPIVVEGVMYVTTGYLRVVALDAATGRELWQFDPLKDYPFAHRPASGGVNRGCAYWSDGKPGGERRIVHGTSDGRLFSLDAKSGKLDPRFGDAGIRDLRKELDPKRAGPELWPDIRSGHLEQHDRGRSVV